MVCNYSSVWLWKEEGDLYKSAAATASDILSWNILSDSFELSKNNSMVKKYAINTGSWTVLSPPWL